MAFAMVSATAIAASLAVTSPVAADDYPNRPIVLVIPLPPGGANEVMARAVSDKMSAKWSAVIRAAGINLQ